MRGDGGGAPQHMQFGFFPAFARSLFWPVGEDARTKAAQGPKRGGKAAWYGVWEYRGTCTTSSTASTVINTPVEQQRNAYLGT